MTDELRVFMADVDVPKRKCCRTAQVAWFGMIGASGALVTPAMPPHARCRAELNTLSAANVSYAALTDRVLSLGGRKFQLLVYSDVTESYP